jgi:hypothetical protein
MVARLAQRGIFDQPMAVDGRARLKDQRTGVVRTFSEWCALGSVPAKAYGLFVTAGRVWAEEYVRAGLLVPVE